MRNSLVVAAAALWAASRAFAAQPAPPGPGGAPNAGLKVLFVITDGHSPLKMTMAMIHALRLKKGGGDARVLFEGEAVVALAHTLGTLDKQKVNDRHKEATDPSLPEHKKKLLGRTNAINHGAPAAALLATLKAYEVPVEADLWSAVSFEVDDELKAAGVTLSGDKDKATDLGPYLKQDYRVLTF